MQLAADVRRVQAIADLGDRYHAGLGSLAKYGYTVPPYAYTRQYLKMVLDRYYKYKAEEQSQRTK